MNNSRDRFEEYLAAGILKDINFIGNNFTVADKPDIISEDIGVEVTTKTTSAEGSKLLFGDKKGIKSIDLSTFACVSCTNFKNCNQELIFNDFPRCNEIKSSGVVLIDNVIYRNPSFFYMGKNTPVPISNSEPLIDLNCEQDIQNIIFDKELKSGNYKKLKELNLFIFYEGDIPDTLNIESKEFKNIFIYSIPTGKLYRNFKMIKQYIGGISEETFNSLISNAFDEP